MQPGFQNLKHHGKIPFGFHGLPFHLATRDGWHFRALRPYSFVTKAGQIIIVEAHTDSDGASTPRWLWFIIPPFGKYFGGAYTHDDLYRRTKYPKAFCDCVFLEAMESEGVSWLMRYSIYWGVRLFGWKAFRDDRQVQNAS